MAKPKVREKPHGPFRQRVVESATKPTGSLGFTRVKEALRIIIIRSRTVLAFGLPLSQPHKSQHIT